MNEIARDKAETASSAPVLPAVDCQDAQAWLDWACFFA